MKAEFEAYHDNKDTKVCFSDTSEDSAHVKYGQGLFLSTLHRCTCATCVLSGGGEVAAESLFFLVIPLSQALKCVTFSPAV